jgi:hypothetical protein
MQRRQTLFIIAMLLLIFTQGIFAADEAGGLLLFGSQTREQTKEESPFSRSREVYRQGVLKDLEETNPWLYNTIMFFNPPALNNTFGAILTVVCAVCALIFILPFEHVPATLRVLGWLMGIYSWGRIFCFFLMMSIIEKGALLP